MRVPRFKEYREQFPWIEVVTRPKLDLDLDLSSRYFEIGFALRL